MTRSKIIALSLATFCGLALQAGAASAGSTTLLPGNSIVTGGIDAIVSGNWHILVMQQDGNVVLYNPSGVAIWSTNTWGEGGQVFIMQSDGNLVLYGDNGALWASQTAGNPGAFLNVQDDGNLVVYRAGSTTETANNALWASNTGGQ